MNKKYKVGDVVVYKHDLCPWAKSAGLSLGKRYTIAENSSSSVILKEDRRQFYIDSNCFEPIINTFNVSDDGSYKLEEVL